MKRIFLIMLACSCFSLQSIAQPVNGEGGNNGRLLNATELRNQKWYYDLDKALENPDKVYKLSLSDQKLKELPEEVLTLKNLQILNLSNCKLKRLPPEIGQLKKLQMISLYDNKLHYLPNEIRQLSNLEVLYLGRNKITTLPIWVGGLGKLRRLDISQNPITPRELSQIRNLMPRVDVTY